MGFSVNDVVRLDEYSGTKVQRAMIWIVTAVNPKTVTIEPVGGGMSLTADPIALVPASEADKAKAAAVTRIETPVLGDVVRTSGLRVRTEAEFFVVIGVNADATVKIAVLGGNENRFINKVPISKCTIVDVATLLARA